MYRVLVGMNYSGKRVEPGTIVDDIPSRSLRWLQDQGVIEPVEKQPVKQSKPEPKPKPKSEPVSEDEGDE